MKDYYIHDGKDQKGPMTLEALLKSGIHAETPIWHAGLDSWTPAKNLEELKLLFGQKMPPPFERVQTPPIAPVPSTYSGPASPSYPIQKKSSGKGIWWIGGSIVLLIIIFVMIANNNSSSYSGQATYTESKMTVGEYERSHPAEFLVADGTYNEALFSTKLKIHGSVTNRASVANFKDINIQVRYYSATKTLIDTEHFVLYDYVPAHTKKSFEWKIKPPGGTVSIGWDVEGATPN